MFQTSGAVTNDALYQALKARFPQAALIGDAQKPAQAYEAIRDGMLAAMAM
jgi:hypothetical protein